jgi:SAM-dependent methyltransferase
MHSAASGAAAYYSDYVEFVAETSPAPGSLLDIGCGGGWSTALFSDRGYTATGIDLTPRFETNDRRVHLLRADAYALPFRAETFDVVATYQTIEHMTDPARFLDEALRVLKPGGELSIVGPNLLSLGASVYALTYWVWKNRPVRRIFVRDREMPRHPFGTTLPEVLVTMACNAARITARSFSSKPVLQMRVPDLRPPFHGDNDACFVCNPIDLARYLKAHGCRVRQNGKPGRPGCTRMLASGTFLAVIKKLSSA